MTSAMFELLRRLTDREVTLVMDTGQEVAGLIVSVEDEIIEIRCPEHQHFLNPDHVVEFYYFHASAGNGASAN